MKNKKAKKSNVQLIISVLKTGKTLKSKDVSDIIDRKDGKFIKVQDVASMLSRVSNPLKSDLGYFLNKVPVGNTFEYHLFKEACALSEEQIYGLTLKTGNAKYTLAQAVKTFPKLATYVNNPKPVAKKADPKPAAKKADPKPAAKKAAPKPAAKKADPKPAAKKAAPKPAAKKADPKPAVKKVAPEKISPENNVFEELEKVIVKLKEMDGKDNMNIKSIDINPSFTLSVPED
jgi:hypothetical protein